MRKTRYDEKSLFAFAAAMALLMAISPIAAAADRDGHGTPRQNPGSPPDPDCWGEVTSTLTQQEDENPGIGEHSSDPIPGDEDRETPRRGVGNNFFGDDTPSEHGQTVSALDGNPDTNCETDRND